jgi:hypothetical protein
MNKTTLADLARELNLSRSTVAGLKARGMPTHSAAAAREWRAAHLDPALRKECRMNFADPAAAVTALGKQVHHDLSRLEELRAAIMGLSVAAQDRVLLSVEVWDALVAPALPPLAPHLTPAEMESWGV